MGMIRQGLEAVQAGVQGAASAISAQIKRSEVPKPKYTPTSDETKVLSMLDVAKRTRLYTLQVFEPAWTRQILYTAGMQHIFLVGGSGTWERRRVEDWVPMPVINMLQSKVQRITDFFTRHRPIARVRPNSSNETDRQGASYGDRLLDYLWWLLDEDDQKDEAATNLIITGNTFRRTWLDISKQHSVKIPKYVMTEEPMLTWDGQVVLNHETGEPVMSRRYVEMRDETGQVVYDVRPQGEIAVEDDGPIGYTVPLSAKGNFKKVPWWSKMGLYPTSYLRDCYPRMAGYLSEKSTVMTSDLYTHRITALLGAGMEGVIGAMSPYALEGYQVVTLYERAADNDFPDGVHLVETDGLPLYIGPLPIRDDMDRPCYSVDHCGYHRVPGRFWWRGAVEDAIGPQDQINKIEQFLQLNDGFNSNPRTYVPVEARIPDGAIKNKPGIVIKYNYPFEPKTEAGMSLPPQMIQRMGIHAQNIEEMMGTRDVVQGGAPPGVTAGVALNQLSEQAEGMFAPISKRYERFIERTEAKKLWLARDYYDAAHQLVVQDPEGGPDQIIDFHGAMLRGNTRVKIESASYRPKTTAGYQQSVIDAVGLGLLPEVFQDPEERRKVLTIMGLPEFKPIASLDYQRAKWESEMLCRTEGYEQVIRHAGDDDVVHILVHQAHEKRPEFLRLPSQLQQQHSLHVVEHLQALVASGGARPGSDLAGAEAQGPQGGGNAAPGAQPADQGMGVGTEAPVGGEDVGPQ